VKSGRKNLHEITHCHYALGFLRRYQPERSCIIVL